MYYLNKSKAVNVGDILTYSELCDLFDKKPFSNHASQLNAIGMWMDIEKYDYSHYKVAAIHPPVSEQKEEKPKRPVGRPRKNKIEQKEKRPVGRPRIHPKEDKPKRPVGRPPLSQEEKDRRATEKEKNRRSAGRPRKNDFRTVRIKRKSVGRPKKDKWNGKTYNYNLRSDAKFALPARNILLKELLNNNGQIIGTAEDYIKLLGMVPSHYFEPTQDNEIEFVEAMATVGYYSDLTLSHILSISILKGLGTNNKLFLVENIYYYVTSYQEYIDNAYQIAGRNMTIKANKILNDIMLKYNVASEADLFYYPKLHKKTRKEFEIALKEELGWFNSYRGKKLTINEQVVDDLKETIMTTDIFQNQKLLNVACIDRIRKQLYYHGQKFYGYHPNTTILFGTDNNVGEESYNNYCSNVDLFIDKYIRL